MLTKINPLSNLTQTSDLKPQIYNVTPNLTSAMLLYQISYSQTDRNDKILFRDSKIIQKSKLSNFSI